MNYITGGGSFPKYSFPTYTFPAFTFPLGPVTAIRNLTVQARSISFAVQKRQTALHPQARDISFTVEDL